MAHFIAKASLGLAKAVQIEAPRIAFHLVEWKVLVNRMEDMCAVEGYHMPESTLHLVLGLSRWFNINHAEEQGVLAEEATRIASMQSDVLTANLLNAEQCKAFKMGPYLDVAAASDNPPHFIHVYDLPGAVKAMLAVVGKGLTFDSGGYNIKTGPGCSIVLMRFDMGDSDAVLRAAKAIGQIKPPRVEVYFVVVAYKNMITGAGMRRGDIVKASNGKTIEGGPDASSISLGVAAATGLNLLAFTMIKTVLRFLGSAALVQFVSKKLLFAKDGKESLGLGTGSALETKLKYAGDVCSGLIPRVLAEQATKVASMHNDVLTANLLNAEPCEDFKMGPHLAAAAFDNPPHFIYVCYTRPGGVVKAKLALVGKGLTFDSGGDNIKTRPSCIIELMKFDMRGSYAVLEAAKAISQIKPPGVEVHFIVVACKNMITGAGMRHGVIVTASNGMTIESSAGHKCQGGLNIRSYGTMNKALLAKRAWELYSPPHRGISQLLKSKYYSSTTFLNAELKATMSRQWKQILRCRDLLEQGLQWVVCDGDNILLSDTRRLPPLIVDHDLSSSVPDPHAKLSALMENHHRSLDKIRAAGLQVISSHIMAIPIYGHALEDHLVWSSTRTGSYTVMSGVKLMNEEEAEDDFPWVSLWEVKCSQKIKHFMWKVVHSGIKTSDIICQLGNHWHLNRVLCEADGRETANHLLLHCSCAKAAWFQQPFAAMADQGGHRTIVEWFQYWLQWQWQGVTSQKTEARKLLLAYITRQIWLTIKGRIYRNDQPCPVRTMREACNDSFEFLTASSVTAMQPTYKQELLITWAKPGTRLLKLNTDGASRSNPGPAGGGAILRNDQEGFIMALALPIGFITASQAEAWVLLSGLQQAAHWQHSWLHVELDSRALSMILTETDMQAPWRLGPLVLHILSALRQFSRCKISNIYGEANQVADGLANWGVDQLMVNNHIMQGGSDALSVTLGAAVATGLGLLASKKIETMLQLLGSAAPSSLSTRGFLFKRSEGDSEGSGRVLTTRIPAA